MPVEHYRSVQHFRQGWLWALLLVGALPAWLLVSVAVLVESPEPWTAQVPLLGLVTVAIFGPLPLFWRANLQVVVRDDGLAIRLWPLHLRERVVACEAIERVEPTEVSPFGDFGGVGVRYNVRPTRNGLQVRGPKGYVAAAGPGVRVTRRDGRPLVVTVDDATAAAAALQRVCG